MEAGKYPEVFGLGKVKSFLYRVYGRLVVRFRQINAAASKEYKTYQVKKNNPGVSFVGGDTVWNNLDRVSIGRNTYINGQENSPARNTFWYQCF